MAKKKPTNGRANGRGNGKAKKGPKDPKNVKPKPIEKKPLPKELDPDPNDLPDESKVTPNSAQEIQKRRATIERRRRISVMLLHGWSDTDIAHKLQISPKQVRSDIKQLRKAWLRNASGAVEGHMSQMIAQQDLVIMKALQGWERSLQDEVIQTQEFSDENGNKVKEVRKGQAGDPRFLDLVNKSNARKQELLGLLHGKTVEQQAQKRFADGYGVVLVELSTPSEVTVAQGMQEFRHQFIGFGEDAGKTVDADSFHEVTPDEEPPPNDESDKPPG